MAMTLLFATATGISSHLLFYIRGEHHVRAPSIVRLYVAVVGIAFLSLLRINENVYQHALSSTLSLWVAYCFGLFTSMIIYRLFFHRLKHFPGPLLAKTTKLWHAMNVLNAKQYLLLDKWHKQYGDFVRTGKRLVARHAWVTTGSS